MEVVSKKDTFLVLAGVLVVVFGFTALFLLPQKKVQPQDVDPQLKMLMMQSPSDELDAIETDLENTDLRDIDRELLEIEQELEQEE